MSQPLSQPLSPSGLDVPGVPETVLPPGTLDRLPAGSAAPPARVPVRAVLWLGRGRPPLPPGSPYAGRTLPVTVGALVDYLDSPVGPYREVVGGVLLRGPGLHVPFIAVDSLPSLRAGREHWALPKTLAAFDDGTATGVGWSVATTTRGYGPRLPVGAALFAHQDGRRALVTVRGLGRAAVLTVAASGPTLPGWLRAGRHPAVELRGSATIRALR